MNRVMTLIVGFLLIAVTVVSGSGIIYMTMSAGSEVILSVEPAVANVNVGELIVITVNVANVRDLNKWEMKISWDPNIMELDQSNIDAVAEGPFLRSSNAATKFESDLYISGSGLLSRVSCCILQAKGASGGGSLLQLRFRTIAEGEVTLMMIDTKLYDYVLRTISHIRISGKIVVASTPVLHDIAVVTFECPVFLTAEQPTQLDVTVKNCGSVDEADIIMSLYVNWTIYQSMDIANLGVGCQNQSSFIWQAYSPGTYNLTITLSPLSGETNIANNMIWKLVGVNAQVSHDVAISFNPVPPGQATIGDHLWLNTTITNLGATENDLQITLYIDGEQRDFEHISEFLAGSSVQLAYNWVPSSAGVSNITAFVTNSPLETNKTNNVCSVFISVIALPDKRRVLIVSDDDGANPVGLKRGTSLPEFEYILSSLDCDVWTESTQGHPSLGFLQQYDIVVWTCGDSNDYATRAIDREDSSTLEQYLNLGGNILVEGQRAGWQRSDSVDSFARNVLHASYLSCVDQGSLVVVDPAHSISANMSPQTPWCLQPIDGSVGITAVNDGQIVMTFGDQWGRGAVVVFNGAKSGIGSVVFYSFPIYWVPENERRILVHNAITWLGRFGVEIGVGKIVNSQGGSVYFVYPDPEVETIGATFSAAAGAMIYSSCKNPQHQGFSSTRDWFLTSGAVNSTAISGSTVVIIGNADCQQSIEYYENTDVSKIKSVRNSTHYVLCGTDNLTIAAVSTTEVERGTEDLIAIQVFRQQTNTIFIIYGFSWRGTWAAGMYFLEEILENPSDFPQSCYVLYWQDLMQDGVPEFSEITIQFSN